jgi:hypothetical protein
VRQRRRVFKPCLNKLFYENSFMPAAMRNDV